MGAAREKLDEERAAEQGKMHVELDEVIPGQVDAIKGLQIVALDGMGDWPYQTIETYGSKALSTPCSIDSLQRQLVLARYPPPPYSEHTTHKITAQKMSLLAAHRY